MTWLTQKNKTEIKIFALSDMSVWEEILFTLCEFFSHKNDYALHSICVDTTTDQNDF